MKYASFIFILVVGFIFNACSSKDGSYYNHAHYHSNQPVVYEYVPLTPLSVPEKFENKKVKNF